MSAGRMMLAVAYDAVGEVPTLREVPLPVCPPDGAIVAVRATGICRSDWHAWRGHDPVPLPMIPGHEFSGVVAEVGPQVTGFTVGDRVTAPFINACGRCVHCREGAAQVCVNQTQPGFSRAGSYAERVLVTAADFNLVRLPAEVDFVAAAALGCRFSTAYHALVAQGQLTAGQWLLVVGGGGVGLAATMIATALGIRTVVVDPSAAARERAQDLGAEVVLADLEPASAATLAELTDGGPQVTVDAVGLAAAMAAGVRSLRPRGCHVQVGLMLADHAQAPLPWDLVVSRELQVLGSHGMAAADYPGLLELVVSGRLVPRRLVGSVIDLDQAGAALAAMDAPAAGAGITVAAIPVRTATEASQ
ncbi:MAG: alcohol dehydrogenase catalytic domain-containing protein [Propioniciclava sp.]